MSVNSLIPCPFFEGGFSQNDVTTIFLGLRDKAYSYFGKQNEVAAACLPNVKKWHAGTNSTRLWGYYDPDFIEPLVVGNELRGRLIKNNVFDSKYWYQYGINGDDDLIFIKRKCTKKAYENEYLIHKNGCVTGITYHSFLPDEVRRYVECCFNDKRQIVQYKYLYLIGEEPSEFALEDYHYDENGYLDIMYKIELLNADYAEHPEELYRVPATKYPWTKKKFIFTHDEEGYFSGYHCIHYYDDILPDEAAWLAEEPYEIEHVRADFRPTMMTIGKHKVNTNCRSAGPHTP